MAELELQVPNMVFQPSLLEAAPDGFLKLFEGLLDDVYKMSSLVPRVAPHTGHPNYQVGSKLKANNYKKGRNF